MKLRIFIFISSLLPGLAVAQTDSTPSLKKMTSDIYSVLRFVIREEGLSKSYGLQLKPEQGCSLYTDDKVYLPTLLIKPAQPDTSISLDSSGALPIGNISLPDKNILTQADIDYILKNKKKFRNLQWDNDRLGFNLANKKYYHSFSIPCFNATRDKVLVMYESLCPGLCGSGKTLLLTKTKTGWDVSTLGMWFH